MVVAAAVVVAAAAVKAASAIAGRGVVVCESWT